MKNDINNPRFIILNILKKYYLNNDFFIQDILEDYFQNNKLNEIDKQFIYNITLGVVRNQILLDEIISDLSEKKKIEKTLMLFLRVSIFQSLFSDTIPQYAIISEMLKTADNFHLRKDQKSFLRGVTGGFFRNIDKYKSDNIWINNLPKNVLYSHPLFIYKKWQDILKEEQIIECMKAGNTIPSLNIFNIPKKISIPDLASYFNEKLIQFNFDETNKAFILQRTNPFIKDLLSKGQIYIQGMHQHKAIDLCPAKDGDKVLEIGAAPGGKTITLSSKVEKEGQVYSVDKSDTRIKMLQQRIKISDLTNVLVFNLDILKELPADFPGKFDHIVLDPPCSNLAELSRRPEARYRATEEDINQLSQLQRNMIDNSIHRLKNGGTFLYITCTLTKNENQDIRDYIQNQYHLKTEKELQTIPSIAEPAGGFACLFRKH